MVTANYFWKDTAPTAQKTTTGIINSFTNANKAVAKAETPTQKSFGDTFAELSTQMKGFSNPYLNKSPETYKADLGTTQGANWGLGQKAIGDQLSAQATGDSTNSRLARSSFAKLADEGQRQLAEQSTLAGRAGTGQIAGDQMRYFANTIMPQKQDLEAKIQAQEEEQASTQRQQGISNLLNVENQTQQAKQFASKQDFDVWSQKAGLSDAEANRLFTATTQDIQNKFDKSERLSSQEFGLMKDAMSLEASALQNQLDRNNQMGIVDKQLEADLNKLKLTQDFADKQQKAQLAQDYDIASKQMGLDQQKIDLSKKQIETDMSIAMERLGMDKSILANDKIKQQIELAGILTQMDDSDEMAEYASSMIANSLQSFGIDMSGVKKAQALTTDASGKLTGIVGGVDISKWYPTGANISDAEKLAQSKYWPEIAKEKGIVDLKNSGVDEIALDGDRVSISDGATQVRFKNAVENKTKFVVNINGVPYMAIPTEGSLGSTGEESFKMVSLDGSGASKTLKFMLPAFSIMNKLRGG